MSGLFALSLEIITNQELPLSCSIMSKKSVESIFMIIPFAVVYKFCDGFERQLVCLSKFTTLCRERHKTVEFENFVSSFYSLPTMISNIRRILPFFDGSTRRSLSSIFCCPSIKVSARAFCLSALCPTARADCVSASLVSVSMS